MIEKIKSAAKMLAALIGALLTAGSTLIPAEWSPYLSLGLAVLTAIATFAIPNTVTPAQKDTVLAAHAELEPNEQNADLQAASARVNK